MPVPPPWVSNNIKTDFMQWNQCYIFSEKKGEAADQSTQTSEISV